MIRFSVVVGFRLLNTLVFFAPMYVKGQRKTKLMLETSQSEPGIHPGLYFYEVHSKRGPWLSSQKILLLFLTVQKQNLAPAFLRTG